MTAVGSLASAVKRPQKSSQVNDILASLIDCGDSVPQNTQSNDIVNEVSLLTKLYQQWREIVVNGLWRSDNQRPRRSVVLNRRQSTICIPRVWRNCPLDQIDQQRPVVLIGVSVCGIGRSSGGIDARRLIELCQHFLVDDDLLRFAFTTADVGFGSFLYLTKADQQLLSCSLQRLATR